MMFLGFDTSNYTTSAAVFDGKNVIMKKKMLEVKHGERGLRQSDALFQHTVNLPVVVKELTNELNFKKEISAVGVSSRPRNIDGSYMPCFLAGINAASAVSAFCGAPLFKTSHQAGHILAALYSADKSELIEEPFIAFHVSGGTTEALLVTPDKDEIIKAELVAESLDLKAGQAIDRTGVMLNMKFPCGSELDELASESNREFKIKPSVFGVNCSLSGVENKAARMIENGESPQDTAKFVITYICETLDKMTEKIIDKYGKLPLVFAGGVSCNSMIKKRMREKYSAHFAKPEFSSDNAAGAAIFAYLKSI